jgi:L-amino acid N-acyltransferase YncA
MIKIRDADNSDLLDLFTWRNDPISCLMSTNTNVTLEEHKAWLEKSFKNPLRIIYIGVMENEKIGVCRFDIDILRTKTEVSINLNPDMRRKNLSYNLLSESIKRYKKNTQIKLTAKIKKENNASLKIFQKCGFAIINENIDFYHLTEI